MEQTTRTRYAVALGLLVAVVVIGVFFVNKESKHASIAPSSTVASTTQQATTTSAASFTGGAVSSTKTGSVAVTGVANDAPSIPLPDLTRPYTPPAGVPQSVQAEDKAAVATAIQQVKIDPNHETYWLQLGMYRQNAGDYVGAEQVYVYLTKRWPKDPIAFANLANLYGNYVHDYSKAVSYANQVIALSPHDISAYINLSTIYRANMQDVADAKKTLEQGIAANPSNTDLKSALAALGQ